MGSSKEREERLAYMKCLVNNWFSIAAMKEALLNDDLDLASEAWHEIDLEDKSILKLSARLGGVFTTEENHKINSDPEKRFTTRVEAK